MMIALVAVAASAKDIKTLVVTTQPVMHCNSCEEKIKNNLRFEKGIKSIETDIPNQAVTITYDADKNNPEKIMKAYPNIIIVGTAGPGSHPGNPDLENGWKLAGELGMPIIDEHYYEPNSYFLNKRQYDSYPRDRKTKVYLGEYAAKDKKLIDALAEGLYLLHVERNGDIVAMTSYAPLFARKDNTNWNPDMIYFDNERAYLTCSYYVQQLFGLSSGQYYYGDCVKFEGDAKNVIQPLENVHYGQSVILNVKTRKLYVKICNASDEAKKANINLSRFGIKKNAVKTVIVGSANDENNYDQQPIAPQKETIKAQKKFTLDVAPYSFIMLEYSL